MITTAGAEPGLQAGLVAYLALVRDMRARSVSSALKAGPYTSVEDYLLKNGQAYPAQDLTEPEWDYVFQVVSACGRRFPIKQCFYNSQLLAVIPGPDSRLTYVEGYMYKSIPVLHGWLEINGKVVDLTARQPPRSRGRLRDRVFGTWTDQRAYFGTKFSASYVRRKLWERHFAGSLLHDEYGDYPLIRGLESPE